MPIQTAPPRKVVFLFLRGTVVISFMPAVYRIVEELVHPFVQIVGERFRSLVYTSLSSLLFAAFFTKV